MSELENSVSLIIPAYNCIRFLPDMMTSVEQQSCPPDELIIVDDGSTDGTSEWLDLYAATHENVSVLHIPNAGPSHARNLGMASAHGTWIQFMDADDCIAPGMIAQMKAAITEGTDLIVCGALRQETGGIEHRLRFRKIGFWAKEQFPDLLIEMDYSDKRVLLNYVWNKWYRRSCIEDHVLRFDETLRLGEDFSFNCSFFKCVRGLTVIPDALYQWKIAGNNSLSTRFVSNEPLRRKKMQAEFCSLAEYYHILPEMMPTILQSEGFQRWSALSKIGLKQCDLPYEKKLAYLRTMLDAQGKKEVLAYFGTLDGKAAAVKAFLVKRDCLNLLYWTFRLKDGMLRKHR